MNGWRSGQGIPRLTHCAQKTSGISEVFISTEKLRSYQTLFLEGTDGLGADFHLHFFAVYHDGLGLEIGLPDFLGVALRKADVVAKLFAFAGEFTLLHKIFLETSGEHCT